jgi:hypothetical protein
MFQNPDFALNFSEPVLKIITCPKHETTPTGRGSVGLRESPRGEGATKAENNNCRLFEPFVAAPFGNTLIYLVCGTSPGPTNKVKYLPQILLARRVRMKSPGNIPGNNWQISLAA